MQRNLSQVIKLVDDVVSKNDEITAYFLKYNHFKEAWVANFTYIICHMTTLKTILLLTSWTKSNMLSSLFQNTVISGDSG